MNENKAIVTPQEKHRILLEVEDSLREQAKLLMDCATAATLEKVVAAIVAVGRECSEVADVAFNTGIPPALSQSGHHR